MTNGGSFITTPQTIPSTGVICEFFGPSFPPFCADRFIRDARARLLAPARIDESSGLEHDPLL
jgi:hypothetical protein